MRLMFVYMIQLLETALSSPGNLGVYLERNPGSARSILILLCLAGLSTATGLFHLRSFYDASFYFFLPVTWIVFMALAITLALLGGSLLDFLIRFLHPEKHATPGHAILIMMAAWLPMLFFLPVSVPARFMSYQTIFMLFLGGALQIWSLAILLQAIRYEYELSLRETIRSLILMFVVLGIFPVVIWVFVLLELTILLG